MINVRVRIVPLVSVVATLLASPAFAQFGQQGSKLVGAGAGGNAAQGSSVAVSADGNTAIVGGPTDDGGVGAAWIWTRTSSTWTQQGPKLVGSGGMGSGRQGTSVAISGDGNTVAVGAPDDNSSVGAVWIWIRGAGVWSQQGTKLVAPSVGNGSAVGLSGDGNTLIVGSQTAGGDTGRAWIWTRSGGAWTRQVRELVGTGAAGNSRQGFSVALASDGDTAIVGGFNDNNQVGAAWIWTRSSGVWTQQGGKLTGSDSVGAAQQGWSVALAPDGNTAIVGGPADNSSRGAAWVWTRSAGAWTQQGSKLVGSAASGSSQQGTSVSMSGDGSTAIVGAFNDFGGVGATWVWTRSGAAWTEQAKLVGSGSSSLGARQGYSVALSSDSATAIVGGFADNGAAGAAWIFANTGAPVITAHPAGSGQIVGGRTSFTASAAGTPAPTVQWQLSTDGGNSFIDIPGATSTTYSIVDITDADFGKQFRAVFTNPVGSTTTNAATLFRAILPDILTHPFNQTVAAGTTATFAAAATGTPTPTVQWQVSTNGGASFTEVAGATTANYSLMAAPTDNGKRFRAVFSNSGGSSTTNAATLTVSGLGAPLPTLALNRTVLAFGGVTTASAFSSSTPPQAVRLSQSGTGTVTWTALSNAPWLVVAPTSGTGAATLTISTQFASTLGASQTGQIAVLVGGAANPVNIITVTLTTVAASDSSSPPFGSFDTPAGDATVLAGSIALTGWALDNIGVKQVELWRDLQPGETTPPGNSTPGDLRNGKIFIANATFVDNARPDVEGANPTVPANYRAGWGYLMLTWGLFGQGNGTYNFHAFGVDQEGNTATIGSKSVIISNSTATKPFGSIDTPAIGGDASGPNFGWGLTPKVNGVATCKIQPSGVQYSIDSGPLQPVVYGSARPDIAGAFAGFSNTDAAGGHAIIDWSALTNGPHTIGWLITDDCGRADGVGSRFFNVTTGTAIRAADNGGAAAGTAGLLAASWVGETESDTAITVARGYGALPEILSPADNGSRIVEIKHGERIEIRMPRGFDSGYQLGPDGQRRVLPAGSTWDAANQTFYWQPAAGFLGTFHLVFTTGTERISVRLVVMP